MTTSLSNHGPIRAPRRRLPQARTTRTTPTRPARGLTHHQLTDRLMWLAWYQPGSSPRSWTTCSSCDTRRRHRPHQPRPPTRLRRGPPPVCGRCGADIGIFIKFGLNWRHYREGAALGQAEIFDPGHVPELTWHLPSPALAEI